MSAVDTAYRALLSVQDHWPEWLSGIHEPTDRQGGWLRLETDSGPCTVSILERGGDGRGSGLLARVTSKTAPLEVLRRVAKVAELAMSRRKPRARLPAVNATRRAQTFERNFGDKRRWMADLERTGDDLARCLRCGGVKALEAAHIEARQMGGRGPGDASKLVFLCGSPTRGGRGCHAEQEEMSIGQYLTECQIDLRGAAKYLDERFHAALAAGWTPGESP